MMARFHTIRETERAHALEERVNALAQQRWQEFWAIVAESAALVNQLNPARRRPWLVEVLEELLDEQGGCCALCGEPMDLTDHHVDHAVPFTYGGGNERGNIQLAHPACNLRKRATVDPWDLLRYLEDRYMNR